MALAQKAVGGRLAAESQQSVSACVWTRKQKDEGTISSKAVISLETAANKNDTRTAYVPRIGKVVFFIFA